VVFIDVLMVKIRDGQVGNRPIYLAIGIDCECTKQVLGHVGRRQHRGVNWDAHMFVRVDSACCLHG
jgi:transposase-like protein